MVNSGIIDLSITLSQIIMIKKAKVLAVHSYEITNLADGRVGTYIYDENKKNHRKNVKAKNYDQMIDKLYMIYFEQKLNYKKTTLDDIFDEWLEYKCKKKNNSPETMKQNRSSYDKYVRGRKLSCIPLISIKTIDLENWAIDILTEFKMTGHNFNTHKLVVTGPLKYAKRKGYIEINPWNKDELEYTHLFKSERMRPSAEMIFYADEIEELFEVLERGFQSNGNIVNLGLICNFDLGLRVGELCALKWLDINWANETLFVQRQECATGEVVDYVKSDSSAGYRELYLTDGVIQIFKRIKNEQKVLSEYVFSNSDGSRAVKDQFEHRLTKAELALGWKTGKLKYSHCIRRTVASRMNVDGWSLEEIRRWLGHTSKETTLKYIFNPYRQNEMKEKRKKTSILQNNKNCLQVSSK